MTHIDPRDPNRVTADPVAPMAGGTDPRQPMESRPASRTGWGLLGGLAAALVLVFVIMTMFGGSSDRTATTPTTERPPIAEGTPAGAPATDPTATGSVPRPQPSTPPAMQPAPAQPAPAQPAPAAPATPNQN
ncbi:MAG: hypothetical protein ACT6XY_04040 [Phreatobacter sp.]|uniref:hypothetical protein n=1 Tax=Phreatobacter sp. TaxID=1966341 RepID=UPI004035AE98